MFGIVTLLTVFTIIVPVFSKPCGEYYSSDTVKISPLSDTQFYSIIVTWNYIKIFVPPFHNFIYKFEKIIDCKFTMLYIFSFIFFTVVPSLLQGNIVKASTLT